MIENSLSEVERSKIVFLIGDEVADVPYVLPLVQQMHKESLFSDLPFDQQQYENICKVIKNNPAHHSALYVEYDEEPVAFAYYNFRPFMGSQQSWVTYMHTLYLRSDIRSTPVGGFIWERIVMSVRAWSAPRSSRGIIFNVMSGIAIEESDAVLRANGSTHLGGNYFMRI